MAVAILPHRGTKTTMDSSNIILKSGELFYEYPDSGVGTGPCRVKMGDGKSTYKNLPYADSKLSITQTGNKLIFSYTGEDLPEVYDGGDED